MKHPVGEANAMSDISIVYFDQDDINNARKHFQAALQIMEKTGNIKGIVRQLMIGN